MREKQILGPYKPPPLGHLSAKGSCQEYTLLSAVQRYGYAVDIVFFLI